MRRLSHTARPRPLRSGCVMSAQPSRMLSIPGDWRRWVFVALLVLTLLSMPPLLQESGKATVIALAAAAVVLLIAKVSLYFRSLAVVAGAVIVPWLSLVGFNWVARPVLKHIGIPLWPGLAIAGVVFAAATWGYLVVWREVPVTAVGVAVLLAVANVVGVPVLLSEHHESTVGGAAPVQTTMDVAILVPGSPASGTPALPADAPATGEWNISWSVARLVDDHPEWLLLSSPDASAAEAAAQGGGATRPGAPTWRPGADRVVVLDVDGTAPGS